jgi:hypothetical protein
LNSLTRHGFVRQDLLEAHEPYFRHHSPQKIKLPDEDQTTFSFTDVSKQLKIPFIIYADFESILVTCKTPPLDANASGTQKIQNHQPSGFFYTIVSTVEHFCQPSVVYRGVDAVAKFLDCLLQEERQISELLKMVVPMNITEDQEQAFKDASDCHICKGPLWCYTTSAGMTVT